MLPNLTSSLASHLPSSSGQAARPAASPESPDDSPDAEAASDKAAGGAAAAPLAGLASKNAQADTHSDPKTWQAVKAVADGPVDLANGAVLEGPVRARPCRSDHGDSASCAQKLRRPRSARLATSFGCETVVVRWVHPLAPQLTPAVLDSMWLPKAFIHSPNYSVGMKQGTNDDLT